MIQLSRTHLALATAAPILVIVLAAAVTALRDRVPAPAPAAPRSEILPVVIRSTEADAKAITTPKRIQPLAVSADGFDQVGLILNRLGEGYRHEIIDDDELRTSASLARFEAVFLTCAEINGEAKSRDLAGALREYVTGGGTLYASDSRFQDVAEAFPEFVDPASVAQGIPQDFEAEVITPELQELVGPRVALHFGMKGWHPAAFHGDDVSVLLRGDVKTTAGVTINAPVAVRFPVGKGMVLFTSFHQEGRVSDAESKLLNFLVLKTVTSRCESALAGDLADAGYSPRSVTALAVSTEAPTAPRDFVHNQAGPLRFRLGHARKGARLRLQVDDPAGKTVSREGDGPLALDIPDASPGRWRYRVTAETAPFPSFPVVVLVASTGTTPAPGPAKLNPVIVASGANVRFREVPFGNTTVKHENRPLRMAVTKPRFDDMARLLRTLGQGYQFTEIEDLDLIRPRALDGYDVLFLTCDGWPAQWGTRSVSAPSIRPGIISDEMRPEIQRKVHDALRHFVDRGGTLYASDLRDEFLFYAFPERPAEFRLDLKLLPSIDNAEKVWLKWIVPQKSMPSLAETLSTLRLSPHLMEQQDVLKAMLHSIARADLDNRQRGEDLMVTVREQLNRYGLEATADDGATLARTLAARRAEIRTLYQSRNQTKLRRSLGDIARAERKLDDLRSKLMIDFAGAARQSVDANVVDAGLQETIGETIRLRFPDNAWRPARFSGKDVTVLIEGHYKSVDGRQVEAPLLVKFRQGKGTVIFTSFHNEAQNSQQELELLRYLVFSAVTAKEEVLTQETLLAGGFSPVKQSQINHQSGSPMITRKYQSTSGEPLRFALVFGGTGAKLRLKLRAPGGQEFEMENDETFMVEATGAPAGEWHYTVTADKVPYENFAYSVSIGKGQSEPAGRRR